MIVPVIENNGKLLIVRLELKPCEVSELLQMHFNKYPGSLNIETEAKKLKADGFPESANTNFVASVFKWSGMQRNLGRVLEAGHAEIAAKLQKASQQIDDGKELEAIQTLCKIPYLGVVRRRMI